MEQFTRNNPRDVPEMHSKTSSVYSTASSGTHASYLGGRDSVDTTTTRPISYTPSYMSALVPPRKAAPITTHGLRSASVNIQPAELPDTAATAAPARPPTASKGLLALVLAAEPAPNMIQHVAVLLQRYSFSGITIIGHREHEAKLKQLRIDLYGLIGKLNKELGVQTYLRSSWSEEETNSVIEDAIGKVDERIRAVLCSPGKGDSGARDILGLSESEVDAAWKQSFGFLHTVARSTFPLLGLDGQARRPSAGFFVTQTIDQGAASIVARAACGALLKQLADEHGAQVGYAEDFLIPEPEAEPQREQLIDPNLQSSSQAAPAELEPDFARAESPTQLWGMWALQDEIGDVV